MRRDQIAQRRSMDITIRAKDGTQGRGFTGLGVPYDTEIELWGMRERFERGSVALSEDVPALVLWQHDSSQPIGRITAGRDTEAGFEIDGSLSDTTAGREAATLLDDEVITRLSIGFVPEEWRIEHDEDQDTDVIVHTKVRAMEFSLVSFPAYSSASISSVRHTTERTTPMDTATGAITRNDLEAITARLTAQDEALDDMLRQIERAASPTPEAVEPHFRSMGDYLKRAAAGDDVALEFHRAFAGGTTGESVWNETRIGTFIKWVHERQQLINLFSRGALPAKGMSVEYAELQGDTHTAGKQSEEGADLPGPGKVKLGTKSAPVETFGGWTELSAQVIERSELPFLDTTMTALGLAYIRSTVTAFRQKIVSTIRSQSSNAIQLPADPTIWDYRDAIIDAGARYTDAGFALTGLMVSTPEFKALQRLQYDGVPALTVRAKDEYSGTLSLPTGDGDLASIHVQCLYGEVPDDVAAFYDPEAIKTLSDGGPAKLQDNNIINLSSAFSLYGNNSFISPFPTAIVPLRRGTAGGGEPTP